MFYYNALLTKVKALIYLGKIKDGSADFWYTPEWDWQTSWLFFQKSINLIILFGFRGYTGESESQPLTKKITEVEIIYQ